MSARRQTAPPPLAETRDIRDTARQEAMRQGLSIGSWLDGVMAERAAALGIDPARLDPTQRIEAVMARLDRVAPAPEASKLRAGEVVNSYGTVRERDVPIRGAEQDTRRSGMPAVALLRESFEDMAMENDRQSDESRVQAASRVENDVMRPATPSSHADDRGSGDVPSQADRAARAASRQAAQRLEIETKLNALFKALDHTPRRSDHAAAAALADDTDGDAAARADLLGKTAITPSWRLEKAIGEIAERQSFLDRQNPADMPSPAATASAPRQSRFGAPRAAVDDLRRHFETPSSAPDVRSAAARKAAPASSIFTTLQGDIARLAKRLDSVDSGRRAPAATPAQARSETRLDMLGQQVETLSAKIDVMRDTRVPLDAIDHLSRRIEDVHTELATRLSAQSGPATIDMASIEGLIRDVVERADRTGKAAPDLQGLETAVHDLAQKLEAAERSEGGDAVLSDLQAQVRVLAERMDRTDAGLTAIVAMERSLGDLFGQMGDMRDAVIATAEVTAQAAAEQAVRTLVAGPTLAAPIPAGARDATVDRIDFELAELRGERDEADKRLHTILAALNTSLERVVDRLGALEDEASARGPLPEGPVTVTPPARAPLVLDFGMPEEAAPRAQSQATASLEDDDLIEPGAGARHIAGDSVAPPVIASAPDPTSFIAAARRAAMSATAEQSARADVLPNRSRASAATARPADKRARSGASARPWVIALASLAILAGAAQIVRMTLIATEPVEETMGSSAPVAPSSADKTQTAAAAPDAADAKAPVIAASAAPVAVPAEVSSPVDAAPAMSPPSRALPTMAMGPAANLAAVQAADLSARTAAAGGIPVGLKAAADAGNAVAQYEVGLRYADGRGVPRDLKTAATWLQKAAEQGLAPAAYRTGSLYEKGLGVARDPAQSIAWYQKAANAGNVRAMHNLAVMLAEGATGKPDYAAAAGWFTKAADAGVRDSQFNLAILYARGMGVEADLGKSFLWFSLAAAQGDADAAKKLEEVAGRLDAQALTDAKAAVAAFKPKVPAPAANEVTAPAGGWDAAAPVRPATSSSLTPAPARVSRL